MEDKVATKEATGRFWCVSLCHPASNNSILVPAHLAQSNGKALTSHACATTAAPTAEVAAVKASSTKGLAALRIWRVYGGRIGMLTGPLPCTLHKEIHTRSG